ncbi:MAG TPA: SprT family zinc-dependent metalloprotease [Methanomicrobiales archaeon]|nr:SprT family zinc-dependent metalloprotease [Methanomicrobiales archaeon]
MPSSPPSPGEPAPPDEGACPEVREREVRRATIQVLPSGRVRVTAPPGTHVPSLLERNAGWIERKREEIEEISRDRAGQEGRILLGGRFFRLGKGDACGIDPGEGVLSYTTPRELKAFLKRMLRSDLLPRIEAHSARMGVRSTGLSVREQRSRWASCSPEGRISVNLRVLVLPDQVRDYLVVHELAHLLEPNHSRKYWKRVGEFFPDFRYAEAELKRYWILVERDSIWDVLKTV